MAEEKKEVYASNSNASKKAKEEKVEATADVKNPPAARIVKTSRASRFVNNVVEEGLPKAKNYIVNDVLIPTFKSVVRDIFSNTLDILLYGGRDYGRKGPSAPTYSYNNNYYNRPTYSAPIRSAYGSQPYYEEDRYYGGPITNGVPNYDELVFYTREQTIEALEHLKWYIANYDGFVPMTELYVKAGVTPPFTSNSMGWTNLNNARVMPARFSKGWVIELPRPMPREYN